MKDQKNIDLLVQLIKSKNTELIAYTYQQLEEPVKNALILWLQSENFPTENPIDLVGNEYVIAWFNDNFKLAIFKLSYDEEEQFEGTIIFSLEKEGKICKYVTDTIEHSDSFKRNKKISK